MLVILLHFHEMLEAQPRNRCLGLLVWSQMRTLQVNSRLAIHVPCMVTIVSYSLFHISLKKTYMLYMYILLFFFNFSEKFDQFWSVNKRLMECSGDDSFKFIPFRIYQVLSAVLHEVKFCHSLIAVGAVRVSPIVS